MSSFAPFSPATAAAGLEDTGPAAFQAGAVDHSAVDWSLPAPWETPGIALHCGRELTGEWDDRLNALYQFATE